MRNDSELFLSSRLRELLRAPAVSTPAARARIMQHVRAMPSPRRLSAPVARSRWSRRGLLSPVGSLVTTCLLLATVLLRFGPLDTLLHRSVHEVETASLVLGDSVVPVTDSPSSSARGISASVRRLAHADDDSLAAHVGGYAQRVLDTLRIVEFVLRGSSIRTATVLGNFNAWNRGATALVATGGGEWRARVLVPRDAVATSLQVAFLVNGTTLVSAARGTARSLVYPN